MLKYPMLLTPVPKEILWGGHRLSRDYGIKADFPKIAESWMLTVRPEGENTIANGIFCGKPISAVINKDPLSYLGSSCNSDAAFPLLIKFIDAEDDLSVQVHPDDDYAFLREGEPGKTEMWVILDADTDSRLVLGLEESCSISGFAEAVRNNDIDRTLRYVPVKKGDVFFIPPGTVHAIGRGILIAEIQQNSNITYRVFDYNRKDKNGELRPLHTEKALDVVKIRSADELHKLQYSVNAANPNLLCSCTYFEVNKYDVISSFTLDISHKSFAHMLVLNGDHAAISANGETYTIAKGESWFLPAGIGQVSVFGYAEILITTLPELSENEKTI